MRLREMFEEEDGMAGIAKIDQRVAVRCDMPPKGADSYITAFYAIAWSLYGATMPALYGVSSLQQRSHE